MHCGSPASGVGRACGGTCFGLCPVHYKTDTTPLSHHKKATKTPHTCHNTTQLLHHQKAANTSHSCRNTKGYQSIKRPPKHHTAPAIPKATRAPQGCQHITQRPKYQRAAKAPRGCRDMDACQGIAVHAHKSVAYSATNQTSWHSQTLPTCGANASRCGAHRLSVAPVIFPPQFTLKGHIAECSALPHTQRPAAVAASMLGREVC